ncbi:hypothetical protein B0J11DRAFT_544359 [Dendryphion nanum]|uniref:Uncharacterized protein n=1 Tax=Dendryphion nanum TaxID=256645 RepID=A0A9P9D0B7_9PLEO|nr:hypothetical protein B0J11DRAFT_544359 [Dendryphion nanum]
MRENWNVIPTPQLSMWRPPRMITLRNLSHERASISSQLIMQIIGSFPLMMLRPETLPPFIHPKMVQFQTAPAGVRSNGILNTCIALCRMFTSRTLGSSELLWWSVRMETDRLLINAPDASEQDLLETVQALVIYIIMKYLGGDLDKHEFDIQLLHALKICGNRLADHSPYSDIVHSAMSGESNDFYRWMYMESKRRTLLMARILNIPIDLDYCIVCAPFEGFVLFPLPAKKVLWDATSTGQWQTDIRGEYQKRETYGVATSGKLIKMYCHVDSVKADEVDWKAWVGTTDSLGTLTMVAASLLQ